MNPLTNDEAALLYVTGMRGIDWYPINKMGSKWFVGPFRSWSGFPTAFKTKKAAVAQFEAWSDLARERFAFMREQNPHVILTAVGVR